MAGEIFSFNFRPAAQNHAAVLATDYALFAAEKLLPRALTIARVGTVRGVVVLPTTPMFMN
jgi:hypothetical protein